MKAWRFFNLKVYAWGKRREIMCKMLKNVRLAQNLRQLTIEFIRKPDYNVFCLSLYVFKNNIMR